MSAHAPIPAAHSWTEPAWCVTPWTCPRCGRTWLRTPEVGEPCQACGYRETED